MKRLIGIVFSWVASVALVILRLVRGNWFQFAVILLLLMIYSRLGEIKGNTFYTADMVDASSRRVISTIQDTADDSGRETRDALYEINDTLDRIRRNQ